MSFVERTFGVYPWDVADGEPREQLQRLCGLGANSLSIPFSYHSLCAVAPHRNSRKMIQASAAVCFRPRPGEFPATGIQPRCSEWSSDEGPVPGLTAMAKESGLRICAWTVVFHNSPLASANPDAAITNCFGDVFAHALCPSVPKSRDYALCLTRAVAARPVVAIELEAAGYYGYEHFSHHDKCGIVFDLFHHFLFSCCFCAHCRRAFQAADLDVHLIEEKFRKCLQQFFDGEQSDCGSAQQAMAQLHELVGEATANLLVRVRIETVLNLPQEIRNSIPSAIELTISSGLSPFECSALFGAEPREIAQLLTACCWWFSSRRSELFANALMLLWQLYRTPLAGSPGFASFRRPSARKLKSSCD